MVLQSIRHKNENYFFYDVMLCYLLDSQVKFSTLTHYVSSCLTCLTHEINHLSRCPASCNLYCPFQLFYNVNGAALEVDRQDKGEYEKLIATLGLKTIFMSMYCNKI